MSKAVVKNFGIVVAGVVAAGFLMNSLRDVKLIGEAKDGFGG